MAPRAFQSVRQYALGRRGRPRFKGRNHLDSVEGKTNGSGIRWRDGAVEWRGLRLRAMIDPGDPVTAHGLAGRVKYVRLVRRRLNGKARYWAQLVCEGQPYQKPGNTVGEGRIGVDPGPRVFGEYSGWPGRRGGRRWTWPHRSKAAGQKRAAGSGRWTAKGGPPTPETTCPTAAFAPAPSGGRFPINSARAKGSWPRRSGGLPPTAGACTGNWRMTSCGWGTTFGLSGTPLVPAPLWPFGGTGWAGRVCERADAQSRERWRAGATTPGADGAVPGVPRLRMCGEEAPLAARARVRVRIGAGPARRVQRVAGVHSRSRPARGGRMTARCGPGPQVLAGCGTAPAGGIESGERRGLYGLGARSCEG